MFSAIGKLQSHTPLNKIKRNIFLSWLFHNQVERDTVVPVRRLKLSPQRQKNQMLTPVSLLAVNSNFEHVAAPEKVKLNIKMHRSRKKTRNSSVAEEPANSHLLSSPDPNSPLGVSMPGSPLELSSVRSKESSLGPPSAVANKATNSPPYQVSIPNTNSFPRMSGPGTPLEITSVRAAAAFPTSGAPPLPYPHSPIPMQNEATTVRCVAINVVKNILMMLNYVQVQHNVFVWAKL